MVKSRRLRFFGVLRVGLTDGAKSSAALLAEALFMAVRSVSPTDAAAAAAIRTEQKHIGSGDGHFLGEPASLRIAAVGLDVLVNTVDAFHHDFVFLRQNAQHLMCAALLRVIAGDHFHHVIFANVHDYNSLLLASGGRKPPVCVPQQGAYAPRSPELHHLSGQVDDADKSALTQLAGHSAEDARAARVLLGVDDDHCIAVKTNVAAVIAARRLLAANDNAADHVAGLNLAAGIGLLDAGDNHIAQACIAPPGAAQHLDAHALLGTGVVGHIQVCIHLNHDVTRSLYSFAAGSAGCA